MTGLIVLTFVPFLVALGFMIRVRAERTARTAAEQRNHELQLEIDARTHNLQEWNASLAHEMRSPLAAVLGYGELLEDGVLGEMDERATDALRRIRIAAEHLIQLVDGVDRAALPPDITQSIAPVYAHSIVEQAADAVRFDADARGTSLTISPANPVYLTSRDDAARALVLALGAAIKASPGTQLAIATDPAAIMIGGTRLDPDRDNPDNAAAGHTGSPLSGAGFRLALARHAARMAGGELSLLHHDGHASVMLRLPPAPDAVLPPLIDVAEQLP